jgi:hypothetical protein
MLFRCVSIRSSCADVCGSSCADVCRPACRPLIYSSYSSALLTCATCLKCAYLSIYLSIYTYIHIQHTHSRTSIQSQGLEERLRVNAAETAAHAADKECRQLQAQVSALHTLTSADVCLLKECRKCVCVCVCVCVATTAYRALFVCMYLYI